MVVLSQCQINLYNQDNVSGDLYMSKNGKLYERISEARNNLREKIKLRTPHDIDLRDPTIEENFESADWANNDWVESHIFDFIQNDTNQNSMNNWLVQNAHNNLIYSLIDICTYDLGTPCSDLSGEPFSCINCGCITSYDSCEENTDDVNWYPGRGTTVANNYYYTNNWLGGCYLDTWSQQMCEEGTTLDDVTQNLQEIGDGNILILNSDTWIIQKFDTPKELNTDTVLMLDSMLIHEGEISGVGLCTLDSNGNVDKTLRYILWGRQGWYNPNTYEWDLQGWYSWHEWHSIKLPVGADWEKKYGDVESVEAIIYFNDNDNLENNNPAGTTGKIAIDNITDVTELITRDPIIDVEYEMTGFNTFDFTITVDLYIKDSAGNPSASYGVKTLINASQNSSWSAIPALSMCDGPCPDGRTEFTYSGTIGNPIKDNTTLTFVVEQEPTNGFDTITRRGWKSINLQGLVVEGTEEPHDTDLEINWVGDVMWGRRFECEEYECLMEEFPSATDWGGAWACGADYPWTCDVSCESVDNDGDGFYNNVCVYDTLTSEPFYGSQCDSVDDCYQHTMCNHYDLNNCLVPGIMQIFPNPPAHITNEVEQYFPDDSLNVLNLETVVAYLPSEDNPASSVPRVNAHPRKTFLLKSNPSYMQILSNLNIDAVSLANNHIMDYMVLGMEETIDHLNDWGIKYNGVGMNKYESLQPLFLGAKQQRVTLISVSDRTGQNNGSWGQPYQNSGYDKPGFAYANEYNVKEVIDSVRNDSDIVVVQLHWGHEYIHYVPDDYTWWPWEEHEWIPTSRSSTGMSLPPGDRNHPIKRELSDTKHNIISTNNYLEQQEMENTMMSEDENYSVYDAMTIRDPGDIVSLKRKYIDMGADMVIGHHPHVVQGFEWYKGKFIAHSLGNFIFDQNFIETMFSVILKTRFNRESNLREVILIPIIIDRYKPRRAKGELGRRILENFAYKSKLLNTNVDIFPDISINSVHDGEPYARVKPSDYSSPNPVYPNKFIIHCSFEPSQVNWLNQSDFLNTWYNNENDSGMWLTYSLRFPRNGSLSAISNTNLVSDIIDTNLLYDNVKYRLGKSILWFGNMEDEGSTLWEARHPLYDDIDNNVYESYNNDIMSGFGEWSIQHIRTSQNDTTVATGLKDRLVGRLIAEHTHAMQSWGSLGGPSFTIKGKYIAYYSGGMNIELKCYRTRQGSSIYTYNVFDEGFVPETTDGQSWTYFEKNFDIAPECNFINIRLRSWPLPYDEYNTNYSWTYFDDIDIIHWDEDWRDITRHGITTNIENPNDYHYLQFGLSTDISGMIYDQCIDNGPANTCPLGTYWHSGQSCCYGSEPKFSIEKFDYYETMYHRPDDDERDWINHINNCYVPEGPPQNLEIPT